MNEEEIIDYLKEIIQEIEYRHKDGELILVNDTTTDKLYDTTTDKLYYSIKGLLDLYNKEIQRNKDLEEIEKEHKEENGRLREELENIEYIKRNFDYCLEQKIKEGIELKIKEKTEELNKEEKKTLKGTKGQDRYSIKLEYMYKRNTLQELLEESEK